MKRSPIARGGAFALAAFVAGLGFNSPAWASFTTTDTTFGPSGTGFTVTNLGGSGDSGIDVTTGVSDRLYALGVACNDTPSNCQNGTTNVTRTVIVSRYSKDGILDTSFGSSGLLTLSSSAVPFASGGGGANAFDIDDLNGLIYLGGNSCNNTGCSIQVARFKFDGTLDTTYGNGGLITVPTQNNSPSISKVLLQPDSKLLVLADDQATSNGSTTADHAVVARYTSSGGADTGFGTNGVISVAFGSCGRAENLSLGLSGALYLAGRSLSSCGGSSTAALARLTAGGVLDSSFGSGGLVVNNFGASGSNQGFIAQEQSNGEVAYGFGAGTNSGFTAHLVLLHADGSQDTSFTEQTATYTPIQQFQQTGGVTTQTDGRLVLNGTYVSSSSNDDEGMTRLDGSSLLSHPARFTDTTPNAFSFTPQTGVATNTVVTSNTVTISGINAPAPVSVSGGSYSIGCNGTFTTTAGTINNGQTVCVRQTSSSNPNTKTTTTLTVGDVSGSFDVTTGSQDTTPNAFSFTSQTGVPVNTLVKSNSITVTGINAPTPISISGGGGQYSVNGGAFTASTGTVSNNDTVQVELMSSPNQNTTTSTTLTIGGISASFSVTTVVPTPAPKPSSGGGAFDPFLLCAAVLWGIRRQRRLMR